VGSENAVRESWLGVAIGWATEARGKEVTRRQRISTNDNERNQRSDRVCMIILLHDAGTRHAYQQRQFNGTTNPPAMPTRASPSANEHGKNPAVRG
jgi:hypothetical protein